MRLVQREGWKILDVRSARAWDQQHITKPARVSVSAPAVLNDNSSPNPNFLSDVGTNRHINCHFNCHSIIAFGLVWQLLQ
jgi:hypothetical protein